MAVVGFLRESPTLLHSRRRWTEEVESAEPLEARRLELQMKIRRASQQLRIEEDRIDEG